MVKNVTMRMVVMGDIVAKGVRFLFPTTKASFFPLNKQEKIFFYADLWNSLYIGIMPEKKRNFYRDLLLSI